MKLPSRPDPTTEEQVTHRYLNNQWATIARVVNNLTLGGPSSSIQANTQGATAGAANTDFPVPHTLGRKPTGFIIISQDAAASIYDGVTPWTTTQIFLRSSTAAVNMTVLII